MMDPNGCTYVCMHVCMRGPTGLEASRAPYSKSHARRLKRKEKEELVGGRLGTLQAALPSIAPIPAASPGERSAGKLDAPAATAIITTIITPTAAASSAKKLVDRSKSTDVPDPEVAPQQPRTRPGQIGEGKGTPLTTSQRRRALYDIYLLIVGHRAPATDVMTFFFDFFFFKTPLLRRKAERFRQPLIRSNPEFASNPFETIRTHAQNTLIPHRLPTT